jgi:PST family polysaccharide transporter
LLRENRKNITYQSFAQVIPRGIMLIFVFYLARILGNTQYGKFEFAMSICYVIGMFFELGGNMILTKHVARNFFSSIYYAVKIRFFSILTALIVFYSVLFIFDLYEDIRIHIIYANIGIAFSSMMNLYFAFFRGARKMNYEAVVLLVQKVIFIILALILLYSDKSGAKALLAFMISMVFGFFIIFGIFKKDEKLYIEKDSTQKINFRGYIKDVSTLALVEVFGSIYYRINQVLIEHFKGFEEVGVYGIAYKIVEVFLSFPSILLLALFPAFAKIAVENRSVFKMQFNKILLLLFAAGLSAGLISWFSGELIFSLLGKDYGRSYIILRYLTIPLLFMFPNFLVTQGLIALDKNIIYAKILFTALLINFIISLILVPVMGAAGSAISIGICEVLIFISGYYFIRKYTVREAEKT